MTSRVARLVLIALFCAAASPAGARPLFSSAPTEEQLTARLNAIPDGKRRGERLKLLDELGTLLYKKGRMVEASQAFEAALDLDPGRKARKHIYLYLGKSYESSGRIDKAIDAYEKIADLDESNWRRQRDLAVLYEQVMLYRQAIDRYEKAAKLRPREGSLYAAMGRTWRKCNLLERAEADLKTAEDLGYDKVALRCEQSRVYEGEGRFADAASAWSECVGSGSADAAWGKLVYLAMLGGNDALAQAGLARLREMKASEETLAFYNELVRLGHEKPSRVAQGETRNRQIKTMF